VRQPSHAKPTKANRYRETALDALTIIVPLKGNDGPCPKAVAGISIGS
jgi:hypothetical protein